LNIGDRGRESSGKSIAFQVLNQRGCIGLSWASEAISWNGEKGKKKRKSSSRGGLSPPGLPNMRTRLGYNSIKVHSRRKGDLSFILSFIEFYFFGDGRPAVGV